MDRFKKSSIDETSNLYNQTVKDLNLASNQQALIYSEFELKRNGIVKFMFPSCDKLKQMENLSEDIDIENNVYSNKKHNVLSQLYFFLKDIAHTHQHHYPDTDTIVDLQKEQGFALETARSLYRKILTYKKTKRLETYFQSRGILTYLKTFVDLAGDKINDTNGLKNLDYDNIASSITVSENKLNYLLNRKNNFRTSFRNVVLSMVGFMFSTIIVANLLDDQFKETVNGKNINFVVRWVIDSPLQSLFLCFLISFGYLFSTGKINWKNWSFVKNIVRLITNFKQKAAVVILFVIAILFIYIASLCFINV